MKKIAILGVDGTGKSTVISKIKERLGDDVVCVYMGCRAYEFSVIQTLQKKHSKIATLLNVFLIYLCFWYRYLKGALSRKTVIFDRYVHEMYINAPGVYQHLFKFIYTYLFPHASEVVYLYCPAEESLMRKDDIDDPESFKQMKNRFDEIFLLNSKTHKYDTSLLSPDEIVVSVIDIIRNY